MGAIKLSWWWHRWLKGRHVSLLRFIDQHVTRMPNALYTVGRVTSRDREREREREAERQRARTKPGKKREGEGGRGLQFDVWFRQVRLFYWIDFGVLYAVSRVRADLELRRDLRWQELWADVRQNPR